MSTERWAIGLSAAALLAITLVVATGDAAGRTSPGIAAPAYGQAFWDHWGDGRAELAGYALTLPRYGEPRKGTAVTIFVTETFSRSDRVKAERPGRPKSDTFPVLKLNLIQDFPTGVYDYNLMTSVFVALDDPRGDRRGRPTKVSFSSQEWCGHVWAQATFDGAVRYEAHSYFDGEADESARLDPAGPGLAEDGLLHWARGLAAPRLEPGDSIEVPLLRSLERSRLDHVPPAWDRARLSLQRHEGKIRVPAGEFEVFVAQAEIAAASSSATYPPESGRRRLAARTWTFYVEQAPPNRIVRWTRDDGMSAELLASERLAYWALNGPGLEKTLTSLGLRPRPGRTP
ncbi:MAG: hypothetical protein GY716_19575 [bacterium]|nr:hypothetical protein [bacterium]